MKTYNNVTMSGMLYDFNLEVKEINNKDAITGTITVQVDPEGTLAELQMFARPVFNNGKENRNYTIMADMINGDYATVVKEGNGADWISVSGQIDTSYFMPRGEKDIDNMVYSQKLRGSFINQNNKKEFKNSWSVDMLITDIRQIEADPEKGLSEYVDVRGYWINDYREMVCDIRLQARKEAAMAYISGLEASKTTPYYVNIRGGLQDVSRVVTRRNAFGEDEHETYSSTQFCITAMDPDPFDFFDDSIMGQAKYEELKANLDKHKKEQFEKAQEDSGDNGLTF